MTCLVCLNVPESKLARPVNCRLKDNGRVRTNTFERCRKRSQDKRSERLTVKVRTRYFKSAFRVHKLFKMENVLIRVAGTDGGFDIFRFGDW